MLPIVACVGTGASPSGALEPRFVAVHNTLAAMGLAQAGPVQEGTLAEGHEARVPFELPAGCSTIVALAGSGVRDLDAQLLDSQGRPVAHDTTAEPQATVHVCPEGAGTFTLVIRMAAGAGSWVAAAWQGGGAPGPSGSSAPAPARQALGTCEAPLPLSAGTVSGSTARGEDANSGSCERSDARELVYELDVTQRQRVTLDVEAHFDSVLYLRKEACADAESEVDCNDDAPSSGRNHSHLERVLEPGRYFVFVDGYNQESGAFKLSVSTSDLLSLAGVCDRAALLSAGGPVQGSTRGRADDAQASCGGGAEGAEVPSRLELHARSRVRLTEHSDDTSPVLHVRRSCLDPASEVACGEAGVASGDAAVTGILDPGVYTVFADSRDRDASGSYALSYEAAPPEGAGVDGDGCGDAAPLSTSAASLTGDTFAARDDVSGTCAGASAADLVYHLDVARRSRFTARLEAEEGMHVLVVYRHCGDRASELSCGRGIDVVLDPGTYFVAVDGAARDAFGRFRLAVALQDLSAQPAACNGAPALTAGRPLSSTSAGSGDRFAASCAGSGDTASTGPDRVYRFTLASRATVAFTLTAPAFEATLSLRRSCADGTGGSTELACEGSGTDPKAIVLERTLEAGTYYAIVDGQAPGDQGAFTLQYRVVSAR